MINRGLFDTMLLAHFKTHYQLPRSFHTVINIPRLKTLRSNKTKTLLKPTKTSQFRDSPVHPLNPGLFPTGPGRSLGFSYKCSTFPLLVAPTGLSPWAGGNHPKKHFQANDRLRLGAPKAGGGIVPGSPAFLSKIDALDVPLVQVCRIIG